MYATAVEVLDLLVPLVVVQGLVVVAGVVVVMTLGARVGELVLLLEDYLVQMIGLVLCVVISTGQSAQNAIFATQISLVTTRVV